MDSLKHKLRFSYGLLISIILIVSLSGAYHLARLGRAIDTILVNNYKSILAVENMKEALERQDSAMMFFISGQLDKARQQFAVNSQKFQNEFNIAINNITEKGEAEIVEDIRSQSSAYQRRLQDLINSNEVRESSELSSTYFGQLEPAFLQLKLRLDDLLHLNQQAMVRASDRAKSESWRAQVSTLLLSATALTLALLFAWRFTRYIVKPISTLTEKAKLIGEGDFDQHILISSQDEIGILAAEFNRMATRLRDIRKSDYWRLLLEQKKSDAVIDSIDEPIIVTDARGNVTKINRAAGVFFDNSLPLEGGPPDDRLSLQGFPAGEQILQAVRDVVSMQRPIAAEGEAALVPIKLGGAERSYRIRATPMRDEDGRLLGAVILLEDITAIQELDRLKTQFISVASGKLQDPLRSLELALHGVISGSMREFSEQQIDLLHNARENASQLEEIMNDLLELAEIESGIRTLSPDPVRPVDLVRPAVEHHNAAAESKHVRLENQVWPDLPLVLADKEAARRIFDNLLSNAIRHTGHDGTITISAAEREDHVFFCVKDSGEGVPHENLPTLFSRFVQVGGRPGGGTGLGLALVKRLVEAQGGHVSVESRVGEGTAMTFTLPVTLAGEKSKTARDV
jgi:two-component system, NtrC family, sensor histidine kinase KinB